MYTFQVRYSRFSGKQTIWASHNGSPFFNIEDHVSRKTALEVVANEAERLRELAERVRIDLHPNIR